MTGFITMHRSMLDHHIVGISNPKRFAAWAWMLAQARWKPGTVDVGGRTIHVKRGQICASIRFMADAWGWDKAAVSRFLTRLKTEAMIETSTETGQTIITICNYDHYQDQQDADRDTTRDTDRDSSETAARQNITREQGNKDTTTPRACARSDQEEGDPTHRERLLSAMGVDPISGLTGYGAKRIGTQVDMLEVEKWRASGATDAEQVAVIAEQMAKRPDGWKPGSFSYFSGAMADFIAAKTKPMPEGQAKPRSYRPSPQDEAERKRARWRKIAGGRP